ncbi:MAG: PHP domain-containing protein [Planctomycetota bacterium]|jgi:HisJ family histidinol phosphate phosphatase
MISSVLKYDFHIHTVFSGHSSYDMICGNIMKKAVKRGLRKIVILEHVPQVDNSVQIKILDDNYSRKKTIRAQIDAIIEERNILKNEYDIEVLVGAEVDADPNHMDGSLLLDDLHGIDVILASTHYLPDGKGLWYDGHEWPEEFVQEMYNQWFVWAMHIAANNRVNIFAHPGVSLCAINAIDEFSGKVIDDFEKLLLVCRKFNTAVELNEQAFSKMTDSQAATYINLFRLAKDLQVKFSIGSDSHTLGKVGKFKKVAEIADSIGLTFEDIYQPRKLSSVQETSS